jgi:hypothetical protein
MLSDASSAATLDEDFVLVVVLVVRRAPIRFNLETPANGAGNGPIKAGDVIYVAANEMRQVL